MNAKFLLGILLLLITANVFSQYSNNIWCFGDSAGLDFSDTTNITVFKTAVVSKGSCTSIANSSNQLFFYSFNKAGIAGLKTTRVFSSTHNIMQGGDSIDGDGWYHELVIVPFPNDSTKFYLFSIGVSSFVGLSYSIIDMTQNGGLGAVTQKNIVLNTIPANDGLVAVKHGNGRDSWLFFTSYKTPNNNFKLYLISPSGIANPIIKSAGPVNPGNNAGRIKFSVEGNKFAMVNNIGQIDYYDFDRCSGDITHIQTISPMTNFPWHQYFSCAFSPSGRYLYVGDYDTIARIYQFDLQAANIASTKYEVYAFVNQINGGGAIKLAPDNKIYCTQWFTDLPMFPYPFPDTLYNTVNTNLSVIHQPDSPGVSCLFTPFSFYLGGYRTYAGLPNNQDYNLGPLVGSGCDTLSLPNPSVGGALGTLSATYVAAWQTIFVNAQHVKGQSVTISVYDGLGSLKFEVQSLKSMGGYFTQSINATNWPSGLYLIELKTDKEKLACKVVIY
jgi:hypothetical protein